MPNELKNCPFCGAVVGITHLVVGTPYNDGMTTDYYALIDCDCGCRLEKEWTVDERKNVYHINNDDIYTAWNRRADDENNHL